jgi:hypothetical protein
MPAIPADGGAEASGVQMTERPTWTFFPSPFYKTLSTFMCFIWLNMKFTLYSQKMAFQNPYIAGFTVYSYKVLIQKCI